MGADFFVSLLFYPTLGIILLLIYIRLRAYKRWVNKRIFDIKLGALLSGILGLLAGLYAFAAAMSYTEAVDRIAEYENLREQGVLSLAWGWSIYIFVLYAPFVLVGCILLLLPILFILSKLRLVSAVGISLVALIFVGLSTGFTYMNPYNDWCEANLLNCTQQSLIGTLTFVLPVSIGFILGARLPILFSERQTK